MFDPPVFLRSPRGTGTIPVRILVTGTRGKSSVTRLLQAAFGSCGLRAYGRITGVLPRELSPSGTRVIRRSSPAHIREMKWWLSQVPPDAEALVVENSAIAPEFQAAVARWVRPTLVVLTSLRPDHREVWGPGQEGAARALFPGIAPGVPVACGAGLARETLLRFFSANRNEAHFAPEFEGEAEVPFSHRESNLALALLAGSLCGLDPARIRPAMASLAPDLADFRILKDGGDELATAFSANDPESTRRLFAETGWDFAGTTILYHHRPDRLARLRDFLPWIRGNPWKDAVFTRQDRFFMQADIPPGIWPGPRIVWSAMDPLSFPAWRRGRGRVFACGNVAGWPLEFLRRESRREAGTAWV